MKCSTVINYMTCLLVFIGTSEISGQEIGIAAQYSGDKGIENDPDVVFHEDFEETTVADIEEKWSSSTNAEGMSLVADIPPGSSGKQSILITSIHGSNTGGTIYKRFSPGFNQLYLRYYIKYGPKPGYYTHSGSGLSACSQPTGSCGGNAGSKPSGDYRFVAGPEPNYEYDQPATGLRIDFYSYWMGMRAGGSGNYYGNTLIQDPDVKVEYSTWTCIEMMLKVNNPVTTSNGELALWIDGKKIIHLGPGFPKGNWEGGNDFKPDSNGTPFEGFQWRSVESLNINRIAIQHYVEEEEEEAPEGFEGKCWFDDLVLATKYIGPISTTSNITPLKPSGRQQKKSAVLINKSIGKGNPTNLMITRQAENGRTDYFKLNGDKVDCGR